MVYSQSKDIIIIIGLNIGRVYVFSLIFYVFSSSAGTVVSTAFFHTHSRILFEQNQHRQLDSYNLHSVNHFNWICI